MRLLQRVASLVVVVVMRDWLALGAVSRMGSLKHFINISCSAGRWLVACPFFMPIERLENGSWLHAARLPLGCGWGGHCTAPGHVGEAPSLAELAEFCNLGYAEGCGRLPRERMWDSVRFAARTVGTGGEDVTSIQIRYVCERAHRPVEHGMLEFDAAATRWERPHHDSRVQRMAECFLESYVEKKKRQESPRAAQLIASDCERNGAIKKLRQEREQPEEERRP